uniref:Uncharacterized protein n=1 Tax=Anguilla anguilla TaxID=7936 RepID=A0A0E9XTF6_ANGAN
MSGSGGAVAVGVGRGPVYILLQKEAFAELFLHGAE